jgi:IS1 family transposase
MADLYKKKNELYCFEADEMWSFVGNKANKQWIWLVINTANRQPCGAGAGRPMHKSYSTKYLLCLKRRP